MVRKIACVLLLVAFVLNIIQLSSSSHNEKGQNRGNDDYEQDWGRVFRLIFISGAATLATMGNIFTISSIIVDDLLRKKGNSFVVSLALADLLITGIVLSASSVSILGEFENSENLCRLQYGISSMSCLTASIFIGIIGIENFLRIKSLRDLDEERHRLAAQMQKLSSKPNLMSSYVCKTKIGSSPTTSILYSPVHNYGAPGNFCEANLHKSSICSVFQVTVLNVSVWFLSGLIVLIHFLYMPQLMRALCEKPKLKSTEIYNARLFEQKLFESLAVYAVCLISFLILGGFGLTKTFCVLRNWRKAKPFLTTREICLMKTNGWHLALRLLIWLPAFIGAILNLVAQGQTRSLEFHNRALNGTSSSAESIDSNDIVLNFQRLVIWPSILPSCLNPLINLVSNADYRRSYSQLFHYCCCKTSVELRRRPREVVRGGNSDVRVHIIPGYNIYNAAAAHELSTLPTRFNVVKQSPLRSCGSHKRDIYEL